VDKAAADRGRTVYGEYCSDCHGRSGRDFSGAHVGKVTPIGRIGTDRGRLDSYTYELAVNQGQLYAGYEKYWFRNFRKTHGYANMPLDGVWLRAPYLHNGSVPTLRDLLEPAARRPRQFYRGYDVYDRGRVGFVADVAREGERRFHLIDTTAPGNSNRGHEGEAYGTTLSAADKDALVEYLKTF
jgi:cytochrome c peroxidase